MAGVEIPASAGVSRLLLGKSLIARNNRMQRFRRFILLDRNYRVKPCNSSAAQSCTCLMLCPLCSLANIVDSVPRL